MFTWRSRRISLPSSVTAKLASEGRRCCAAKEENARGRRASWKSGEIIGDREAGSLSGCNARALPAGGFRLADRGVQTQGRDMERYRIEEPQFAVCLFFADEFQKPGVFPKKLSRTFHSYPQRVFVFFAEVLSRLRGFYSSSSITPP